MDGMSPEEFFDKWVARLPPEVVAEFSTDFNNMIDDLNDAHAYDLMDYSERNN